MMRWEFTVVECEQRTPEWYAARAGRLTGSVADAVMARIKTGEAAARRDLRVRLVTERLTGVPQEDGSGFQSKEMQRGVEIEPQARAALEAREGYLIETCGFLACTSMQAGCSLDGHVDDFGGIVELKCPKSATHLKYLRGRELPSEYRWQVAHNLLVSGAQWCDFASYDDRFPSALRLFVVRVQRSQIDLAEYERAAQTFLSEVESELEAVRALMAA